MDEKPRLCLRARAGKRRAAERLVKCMGILSYWGIRFELKKAFRIRQITISVLSPKFEWSVTFYSFRSYVVEWENLGIFFRSA